MNQKPKKPKQTHPWRNTCSSKVVKWAKEQSDITNVQTILSARGENLSRKDRNRNRGGLM